MASISENSLELFYLLDNCEDTNYKIRKICQEMIAFHRALSIVSSYYSTPNIALPSGSSFDGSYFSGIYKNLSNIPGNVRQVFKPSDKDFLVLLKNVIVLPEKQERNGKFDLCVFQMERCCNPLFVKLKIIHKPYFILTAGSSVQFTETFFGNFVNEQLLEGFYLPSTELIKYYKKKAASSDFDIQIQGL